MHNPRKIIAIAVGKIMILLSRMIGRQGSNLPGLLALKIYPPLLRELSDNTTKATYAVTGTNGKTTTTNMIASIIRESGHTLVHNQAGANMLTGILTAFIDYTNLTGSRPHDYALLETDEANIPSLLTIITPRYILVTNFFRDQLDRYGELDQTIRLIKDSVKGTNIELILNADDPLQSQFQAETGLKCWYYGLENTKYDVMSSSESREGRYCVVCGHQLEYQRFHYAQLGDYLCPQCGNHNPKPDFTCNQLQMTPAIQMRVNDTRIVSPYQGIYNAYNILAAASLCKLAGFRDDAIQTAIANFNPTAGRQETFVINGKPVLLLLVKNPTGLNQTLAMLSQDDREKNLFIALNDNAADGRDISWIWDAEVESVIHPESRINRIICSGQRCGDMAVRFKYAGFATERIMITPSLRDGIGQAVELSSQVAYVLCTYTALFAARHILIKMHPEKDEGVPGLAQGGSN